MSEPMTDERLSEIRARVKNAWAIQAVGPANMGDLEPWQLQSIAVAYVDDVADLLAEVDRLRAAYESVDNAGQALMIAYERVRAENAAMRPVVEAVALREMVTTYLPATSGPPLAQCAWCRARHQNSSRIRHHDDCPVVKARLSCGLPAQNASVAAESEDED